MLVSQAEGNEASYLQFADMLVSHELSKRDENRVNLNMKRAGFPVKKQIEEFDFVYQTSITKKQINRLLDFSYIDNRENIVFIRPPGVGKTHLAIGISYKSIHNDDRWLCICESQSYIHVTN
jgi:DNA replication protein DnaC